MAAKDKDSKSQHPVGSRQNPIVKGPNSQAGVQAHKPRRGYLAPDRRVENDEGQGRVWRDY